MEPINKMIESSIRRYKLQRSSYEFRDLHADALSFLIIKFEKFKPEKGYKSYSYFGTICKNYLYNEMMKEYKRTTAFVRFDNTNTDQGFLQEPNLLYVIDKPEINMVDFMTKLIDSIRDEIGSTKLNENEFKVGHALINILEDWPIIFQDKTDSKNSPKFNKNLILLYIRNISGLNTKEIRNGLKRFKSLYALFKGDYLDS
jgi:hypothetical protein